MKQISIIIPFKNTLSTLPRLFASIPEDERIEILLVENSNFPLKKEEIGINREYTLLNAKEDRFAGGARNEGIDHASGEWLIFADSDDFFSDGAFDVIFSFVNSRYDLIYFGCDSVYDDTLIRSDRHLMFHKIVADYVNGSNQELKTRLYHVVPWAKMVRRSLVNEFNIRFDEVLASNDMMFSTMIGHRSKCFWADERVVYIVTTRKGSLAYTWNYDILKSRYLVWLRRNEYLKSNNMQEYQVSIMGFLHKAFRMRIGVFLEFLFLAIRYKQNIFIGASNWFQTACRNSKINKKEEKYIVNN